MQPEPFENIMFVRATTWQTCNPLLRRRNDFVAVPTRQLNASTIANAVIAVGQRREQFFNWFPGDGPRLLQRPAFIRHLVNPAMRMIAARIAQIVLHVPDDRVLPIEEVDRSIWSNLHVRRPEI